MGDLSKVPGLKSKSTCECPQTVGAPREGVQLGKSTHGPEGLSIRHPWGVPGACRYPNLFSAPKQLETSSLMGTWSFLSSGQPTRKKLGLAIRNPFWTGHLETFSTDKAFLDPTQT